MAVRTWAMSRLSSVDSQFEAARVAVSGAERLRDDRADFGDQVLGAEHGGLDLVPGQHQGRNVEAVLKDISAPCLAPDRRALADQVGDVAIDGAFGNLQFVGNRQGGDGLEAPAQDLDNLEQAVGAAHGSSCQVADRLVESKVVSERACRWRVCVRGHPAAKSASVNLSVGFDP